MLLQIISHTPLYVWAIFGLLLWRGMVASREREVGIRALCLLPLLMMGLSVQGMTAYFGGSALAPLAWLGGLALGLALGWSAAAGATLATDPARGVVRQAGSWLPLALMMAIFGMKYVLAVLLAVAPVLRQQLPLIAGASVLFGLFSGVFGGRVLRTLAIYRQPATLAY